MKAKPVQVTDKGQHLWLQKAEKGQLPPHFALVMDVLMEGLLYIRLGPFFSTVWQEPPLLAPATCTNHCSFASQQRKRQKCGA